MCTLQVERETVPEFAFLNWHVIGWVLQKQSITLHSMGAFREENRESARLSRETNTTVMWTQQSLGQFDRQLQKEIRWSHDIYWFSLASLNSKQISISTKVCHSAQWWCKWPGLPPCPAQLLSADEAVWSSRGQYQRGDARGCILTTFSPASHSLKGIWVVHLQSFTLCSSGIHFPIYIQEVTPGAAEFWWAFLPVQTLRRGRLMR